MAKHTPKPKPEPKPDPPEQKPDPPEPKPDPPEPKPGEPIDFEMEDLWAAQPLAATITITTKIAASTKPPKDAWFRTMPFDLNKRENCQGINLFEYTFEGEMSPETYYVLKGTEVCEELLAKERLIFAYLFICKTHGGSTFVWEAKAPGGQNRNADSWAHSRLSAAQVATTEWIRLKASNSIGGYNLEKPKSKLPEPDWDDVDVKETLKLASTDKVINSMDHPAVKEFLGL